MPTSALASTALVALLAASEPADTSPAPEAPAATEALQPGFFVSTLSRNGANWGSYGEVTVAPTGRVVGTFYDSTSLSGRQAYGNSLVPSMPLSKARRGEGYRLKVAVDLNSLTNNRFLMPWGFRDPGFNALARAEVSL